MNPSNNLNNVPPKNPPKNLIIHDCKLNALKVSKK